MNIRDSGESPRQEMEAGDGTVGGREAAEAEGAGPGR